jgi:hypothetical protein
MRPLMSPLKYIFFILLVRWEQERVRQEHLALERWRQEAREHEKQLFGMFCHAMAQCNAALTTMLK